MINPRFRSFSDPAPRIREAFPDDPSPGSPGTHTTPAAASDAADLSRSAAAQHRAEEDFWRENYRERSYSREFRSYDDVAPAYRYGWEQASKPANKGRRFDECEATLRDNWDLSRGSSMLRWNSARGAVKDAWDRVTPSNALRDD